YVDVRQPHRVSNRGSRARVHLVIDADVNDWLRDLFARGKTMVGAGAGRFAAFAAQVFEDSALRGRLAALPDERDFLSETLSAGQARGFRLDAADVEARQDRRAEEAAPSNSPDGRWVPVSLQGSTAEWVYFGARKLCEPFFDDDVRMALRTPFA